MKIYAIVNACIGEVEKQKTNLAALLTASGLEQENIIGIVLSGNIEDYHPEPVLQILQNRCGDGDMILFPGSDWGSELAVRLSARLHGTGVVDVLMTDPSRATVGRRVYAGNLLAEYHMRKGPWCLSVDRSLQTEAGCKFLKTLEKVELAGYLNNDRQFYSKIEKSMATGGLADADLVVACGQGLRKQATVDRIAADAAVLGAETGASRPVVMNAWMPMENLIGVSGNMIQPKVCLVAAASGSPAFFAGIEHSGTIIAINTDENAPIMRKSDLAVQGDAEAVMGELARLVKE